MKRYFNALHFNKGFINISMKVLPDGENDHFIVKYYFIKVQMTFEV